MLVPRNPSCYVFPIEEIIKDWFDSEEWVSDRNDNDRDAEFWVSEYVKRVNARLNGKLLNRGPGGWEYVVLEVGMDDVSMRKWGKTNTGMVCVRALDLGLESRGLDKHVSTLMLRPQNARVLNAEGKLRAVLPAPYLSEFRETMKWLAKQPLALGAGKEVNALWLVASGDTPMCTKFMDAYGHTAYFGDFRSFFTGMKITNTCYYFGYSCPQKQYSHWYDDGASLDWFVDPEDGNIDYRETSAAPAVFAKDALRPTHDLLAAAARRAAAEIAAGRPVTSPLVQGHSLFTSLDGEPLPFLELTACSCRCTTSSYMASARRFSGSFWTSTRNRRRKTGPGSSLPKLVRKCLPGSLASPSPTGALGDTGTSATTTRATQWKRVPSSGARSLRSSFRKLGVRTTATSTTRWSPAFLKACRGLLNARSTLGETQVAADALLEFATLAETAYRKEPVSRMSVQMFTQNLSVLVQQSVSTMKATGQLAAMNELWIERAIRSVCRRAAKASTNAEAFVVNEAF